MKYLQLIILSLIMVAVSNNTAIAQTADANTQEVTTKTIAIKVKGVTCRNDLKSISANVEKLEGVTSCKPKKKGATSTFEVVWNAAVVSQEEIHAAITNTPGCKNPKDRPYKIKS